MAAQDGGTPVYLYAYDLTRGMARVMSPMILGFQVDAVWHSAVVVDGIEYFFGMGVQQTRAGTTMFGQPQKKIHLGNTHIPPDMRTELLADLSTSFQPQHYNIVSRNCNHFSHAWSTLLTGNGVPDDIVNQAQQLLSGPLGAMVQPMLQPMQVVLGGATAAGPQPSAPVRPPPQAAMALPPPLPGAGASGGSSSETTERVSQTVTTRMGTATDETTLTTTTAVGPGAAPVATCSSAGAAAAAAAAARAAASAAHASHDGVAKAAAVVTQDSATAASAAAADALEEALLAQALELSLQDYGQAPPSQQQQQEHRSGGEVSGDQVPPAVPGKEPTSG